MSQLRNAIQGAKNKMYAGIGSTHTPPEVQEVQEQVAAFLAREGWTLRSGGAIGADTAFEEGAVSVDHMKVEVYLPFQKREGRKAWHYIGPEMPNWDQARQTAAVNHPGWMGMKEADRVLHSRNTYQILGKTLEDPVDMVLCWTEDGAGGGGTGQALRIAKAREIPVFDMGIPSVFNMVKRLLESEVYEDFGEGDRVSLRCAPDRRYTVVGVKIIPKASDGKYPEERFLRLEAEDGSLAYWKSEVLRLEDD